MDANHKFEVVDLYASGLVQRFCKQPHEFHAEGPTPPPEFDLDLTDDNKLRVLNRLVDEALSAVAEDGRKALREIHSGAVHPPYLIEMEEGEQSHVAIRWPGEDVAMARAEQAPSQFTQIEDPAEPKALRNPRY